MATEVGIKRAAGGRRPFRPPDAPLASEDAPLHLRRARRHLHHRPDADGRAARAGARVRRGPRVQRRRDPLRRHQEAGQGHDQGGRRGGRHALRERALARRPADELPHDAASGSSGCTTCSGCPRRASSTCSDQGAHVDGGRAAQARDQPQRRRATWSGCPDAVFVTDLKVEEIGVREAARLNIPTIGLVDTNCDPEQVDYVIPGNDDAIRSNDVVIKTIGDAAADGRRALPAGQEQARREAEEARAPRGRGARSAGGRGARPPRGRGAGDAAEAEEKQTAEDAAAAAAAAAPRRAGSAAPRPSGRGRRRPQPAGTSNERHRQRRQGAARPHRRRHDGVQARARGGRRRRREGGRDPARQGPGEGRQARRARGGRGRRLALRPLQRAASACSSRSTARPTSWPATTSSSEFARDIAIHVAAAAPRWVSEEDVPGRGARARARDLRAAGGRRQAARGAARRSPRAACASGSRRSCC